MLPVTLRVIPVVRRYEGYPMPGSAVPAESALEPA